MISALYKFVWMCAFVCMYVCMYMVDQKKISAFATVCQQSTTSSNAGRLSKFFRHGSKSVINSFIMDRGWLGGIVVRASDS